MTPLFMSIPNLDLAVSPWRIGLKIKFIIQRVSDMVLEKSDNAFIPHIIYNPEP